MNFSTDQRIGPYTLRRKLGSGGFGEVWLARRNDVLAAPEVAIKMPINNLAHQEAIRSEAEVWVSASGHPNVLPVIEFNVYGGQLVIVSEYVAGGSLTDWLMRHGGKAPSVEIALEITLGILAGLQHLHTRQPHPIIHCDLKPDNILMQGEIPRLTDFGISRVSKTTASNPQFIGTLAYMSPEAFYGAASPQRDLWAVGVILYTLLTAKLPFPQEDASEVKAAILWDTPPLLPETVPAQLRNTVNRALSKDPAKRFESAAEMRAALLLRASVPQPAILLPFQLPPIPIPPLLPSQKPTVDAEGIPLPPSRTGVPVATLPVASSGVPTTVTPPDILKPITRQPTRDSRTVPLRSKPVKVVSAYQAKREEQQNNRITLLVLLGIVLLTAGLWQLSRLEPAPVHRRPVKSPRGLTNRIFRSRSK